MPSADHHSAGSHRPAPGRLACLGLAWVAGVASLWSIAAIVGLRWVNVGGGRSVGAPRGGVDWSLLLAGGDALACYARVALPPAVVCWLLAWWLAGRGPARSESRRGWSNDGSMLSLHLVGWVSAVLLLLPLVDGLARFVASVAAG